MSKEIKKVAVVGAGTMGNGICHVFAQTGHDVNLVDISQEALDKALATIGRNLDRQIKKEIITEDDKQNTLDNITTFTDMASALEDRDIVVEAATENIEFKEKIFAQMDEHTSDDCILASNTSSVSITRLGSKTTKPSKVIGMHFMNPVPVMKLVEIINGYATSLATSNTVTALAVTLGKVPCVAQDYPGFVANRILMPMINEAIISLQEGVAGVEEIDTIMKLGMGHPMGPLQLADFIGLDTCYSILDVMATQIGKQKYAPATLLKNMVQANRLGRKSGEGFYKYTPGSKELVVSDNFKKAEALVTA